MTDAQAARLRLRPGVGAERFFTNALSSFLQARQPPTEKELRFRRRTRLAIAFAVVSVAAYVVLGEMVEVRFGRQLLSGREPTAVLAHW